MRILLVTRGAPGAGKSTWIKKNNLENYKICPDDFRIYAGSFALQADGSECINQTDDMFVWEELFKFLEYRMKNGEFTIVDATASRTIELNRYKKLCQEYKYKMYCVDFTDVPLETCIAQNKNRRPEKWVPDNVIETIYNRFKTQPVPSGVTIIKPEELSSVFDLQIDLSNYKKIVHIGDIHGCYKTLMEYFKDGLHDDWCYIFLGDYIDRGQDSGKVMKFIDSIKDLPNVCLLEGNHERYLNLYGNDYTLLNPKDDSGYNNFNMTTRNDLIKNDFTQKDSRIIYRKLKQISFYKYHDKEVLACHGGIPHLNKPLALISSQAFIHGVGSYNDYIVNASTWMSSTKPNQYLIHGHRNTNLDEIQMADRVFNLEGSVEFGEPLRILELDENGWHPILIENQEDTIVANENIDVEKLSIENAIQVLRQNKFIKEKKLLNNISSFNFSREAFNKQNWTGQTILARGLFIDTESNEIRARSYEKFFRVNEHYTTELSELKNKLVFPVQAYKKENGFLAIVSYNPKTDDLFVASKSTNKGDFVKYIQKQLVSNIRKNIRKFLKNQYENNQSVTMVFECIDIDNDPHIIKYDENNLILLDIIYNDLHFKKYNYDELTKVADRINVKRKELVYSINNWEEFTDILNKVSSVAYKLNDEYIEGYVFEDASGFMVKVKTEYYNQWKKLRRVAQETFKFGYIMKESCLTNKLENDFYQYCKDIYKRTMNSDNEFINNQSINMIKLRESFLK